MRNIILLLVLILSSLAYAENGGGCNVPICDIPAKIAELGSDASNDNVRYHFVLDLKNSYKNSNDLAALENLMNFAIELKKLSTDKHDAAWVVQEIDGLAEMAILGLIKFSSMDTPLMEYFEKINRQGARNDVAKYFQENRILSEGNPDVLRKIISFGQQARSYLEEKKEEKWLISEFTKLLQMATKQLLFVDPYLEGSYEVEISIPDELASRQGSNPTAQQVANGEFQGQTQGPSASEQAAHPSVGELSRLILLETGTSTGFVAVFFSQVTTSQGTRKWQAYSYSGDVAGGDSGDLVEGDTGPGTIAIQNKFMARVDHASGKIVGWLNDTHHLGSLVFKGRQLTTPAEFFREEVPVQILNEDTDIAGKYRVRFEGNLSDAGGTVIIKKYGPRDYRASYLMDCGITCMEFKSGNFIQSARRGILDLTSTMGGNGFVKWVLASVDKESGRWKGMGISSNNGEYYQFTMERISSVEPVPGAPELP